MKKLAQAFKKATVKTPASLRPEDQGLTRPNCELESVAVCSGPAASQERQLAVHDSVQAPAARACVPPHPRGCLSRGSRPQGVLNRIDTDESDFDEDVLMNDLMNAAGSLNAALSMAKSSPSKARSMSDKPKGRCTQHPLGSASGSKARAMAAYLEVQQDRVSAASEPKRIESHRGGSPSPSSSGGWFREWGDSQCSQSITGSLDVVSTHSQASSFSSCQLQQQSSSESGGSRRSSLNYSTGVLSPEDVPSAQRPHTSILHGRTISGSRKRNTPLVVLASAFPEITPRVEPSRASDSFASGASTPVNQRPLSGTRSQWSVMQQPTR